MSETLELQIKSTADQAARSIGNLESKLRSLGGALSSINGSNLHSFSSGLSELATSIRSLSGIDTRTFTKVSQNMQKLGTLDSSKLVSSASALSDMSRQLSTFSGLAKQSQNITTLIQSISKLGGKSSANAADNIRNLGSALKEVMATLSNTPTVSNNIIQMTNALANLASQGSKVGSASRSLTTNFSSVTKSAKTTKSGFSGLASAFGKFYATYFLAIRAIGKLGDAVDLSSQLTEVQNVVDTTFGDMTSKVEDFVNVSIGSFGMSELTAKQIASRFQAMGTAVGISASQVASGSSVINSALESQEDTLYSTTNSMADMSLNLTKLAADMASFYDVDQEDVAKSLESVFTGTTAPLRQYGLDITQATLKEWAMKQGIDADISSMSQAEKVMLRYQYVMANTTAAQGDFAKTADTWANSVRTLKQEFEAWGSIIGKVIINAFKPFVVALKKAMVYVIQFTQTVADALGAIFGWTIEVSSAGVADDSLGDVSDSLDDVGSSADSANSSAKALKKTLLSIDEIHALDDNSSSSSGSGSDSGSGSTGTSGSGLSTTTKQVDGLVEKYKSSIKDLYELGSYIGNTIADSLNSINWDSVYQGAKDFGTGLAEFLNGLISPKLFEALGKTIAGSIRTAIVAAFSFTGTFDWGNLGDSFAAFLNGALHEMSRVSDVTGLSGWQELGQTINNFVHGIRDALIHAIENIDWNDALKGIAELVGELDIDTFAIVIGAFVWKHGAKKITKSVISSEWSKFAKAQGISNTELTLYGLEVVVAVAVVNFILSHMKGWVDSFKEWMKSDKSAFGGHSATTFDGEEITLSTPLKWKIEKLEWDLKHITWGDFTSNVFNFDFAGEFFEKAKEDFATAFDGNRNDIVDIGGWIFQGIIDGFCGAFVGLVEPFVDFFNWVWGGLCDVLGIASPAKEMKPIGDYMFRGIVEGFKGAWDSWTQSVNEFFDKYVTPIFSVENWKKKIGSIRDAMKSKWEDVKSYWNSKGSLSEIKTKIENVKERVKSAWGNVVSYWNSKGSLSEIRSNVQTFKENVKSKWEDVKSYWNSKGKLGDITAKVNDFVGDIKSKWNSLSSWWGRLSLPSITAKIKLPHISVDWTNYGKFSLPSFNIKYYKSGGFPQGEDGMFLANHNEMIGKFSNGKTAVANNEQITEGIKRAVVEGMMQVAMATSTQSSTNAAPIIENTFKVDSETLYRMTQKGKAKHNQRYNVVTEF